MKINYILFLLAVLVSGMTIAQETQKNFINYQGVARNGAGQLMANESMTIGIALKIGSATGAAAYAENHSIVTDANGVFSLKIGNGDTVSGEYNTIPWGSNATFITVLVNGSEVGSTEIMAVPYALSSGDGAQQADEVPYDNSVSGLTATNAQEAIDELVGSGVVDADADPANELQDISLSGTDLSISEGSTIDLSAIIPPGGTDDQNAAEVSFDNTTSGLVATNAQAAIDELATSGLVDTDDQDLSLSGTTSQITDGTGVDLSPIIPPGGTDSQNAAEVPFNNTTSGLVATNAQAAIDELATSGLVDTDDQDLSLSGTTLQITDGTGVDLSPIIPPGGTDDQNAGEVPFDNTTSGLVATNTQAAIDELATTTGASLWTESGDIVYRSNGQVGIGTDDPSARLAIVGETSDLLHIKSTLSSGSGWIRFNNPAGRIGYIGMFNGNNDVEFGTSGSNATGKVYLTTTARPRLTVAANGDVGIGTTDPETKLHVAGGARIEEGMSARGGLFVRTNGGRTLQLGGLSGNQWILNTNNDNGDLVFLSRKVSGGTSSQGVNFQMQHTGEFKIGGIVENDAWMHIRENSRVGKPHLKLQEVGNDYARLELTNSSSRFWHLAGYVGNSVAQDRFNIYNSAEGNIISVHGNGNVVINGAVAHSSDRRLKRDITALPYGLETVMQLSPKAYYWKKNKQNDQRALGLIAQEVRPLIKEVVHGADNDEDMLSISYTELVPVLIKAIQDQQELISRLQGEHRNTKSEISLLKTQLDELIALRNQQEVSTKE
ncbi:tail fiber domain-containing protein [Aggregatimonas sangjinii]|nr:tail fiber domain-containing protein [Aggregatimonas sangjinii]